MNKLRGLFGAPAQKPSSSAAAVEENDDDIYPVHMLDDGETMRKLVMAWTMRFNDVLDAEKLHDALSRLLEIGDWRKLGGRLKLLDTGKLEIHVPRQFTAERPAVAFTHNALLEMSIEEHPVACRLPRPTDGPSTQPAFLAFQSLAADPDTATTLEEIIRRNAPQISLHITSFNDATLVGILWPHTLMDGPGYQALMRAWSLVLAGREQEVPPLLGTRTDVLWEAADPNRKYEELLLEKKRLTGIRLGKFASRFAWDMARNSAFEARIIFIPKKTFEQILSQAREEAKQCAQHGHDPEKVPFVSESDVLAAWAARLVALSEPKPRPATVVGAVNARFRPQGLLQPGGVYVQNMVLKSFMFLSAEQSRGSVGQSALAHRRQLMEQTTQGQVLSLLRASRKAYDAGVEVKPFFGEADALLILVNNMTKIEIIKSVDFAAAVVRQGEKTESRSNPPGTMVRHHLQWMNPEPKPINCFVVFGKDHDEHRWLSGYLMPRVWAKLEEEMKKM